MNKIVHDREKCLVNKVVSPNHFTVNKAIVALQPFTLFM